MSYSPLWFLWPIAALADLAAHRHQFKLERSPSAGGLGETFPQRRVKEKEDRGSPQTNTKW